MAVSSSILLPLLVVSNILFYSTFLSSMRSDTVESEVNSTRGVSLDFVRLPSIIAGTTEPEWTHINIGEKISIVDFTMDVEQDLLVLIEQKFSFNGE